MLCAGAFAEVHASTRACIDLPVWQHLSSMCCTKALVFEIELLHISSFPFPFPHTHTFLAQHALECSLLLSLRPSIEPPGCLALAPSSTFFFSFSWLVAVPVLRAPNLASSFSSANTDSGSDTHTTLLKSSLVSLRFVDAMTTEMKIGERTTAPMLFCSRCSNLLYPEGDPQWNMVWRCNYCRVTEIHKENLVYVINTNMKSDVITDTKLLAEFASDPTAQRSTSIKCAKCKQSNVAYFVNPLGQPQEDMTHFYACTNPKCRHVWSGEITKDQ